MNNVVDLTQYRKDPHGRGGAICLACHHKWEAVVTIGTVTIPLSQLFIRQRRL